MPHSSRAARAPSSAPRNVASTAGVTSPPTPATSAPGPAPCASTTCCRPTTSRWSTAACSGPPATRPAPPSSTPATITWSGWTSSPDATGKTGGAYAEGAWRVGRPVAPRYSLGVRPTRQAPCNSADRAPFLLSPQAPAPSHCGYAGSPQPSEYRGATCDDPAYPPPKSPRYGFLPALASPESPSTTPSPLPPAPPAEEASPEGSTSPCAPFPGSPANDCTVSTAIRGPNPNASSLRADTTIRTMLVGTISSSEIVSPFVVRPSSVISTSAPPVSISRHTTCAPAFPSCR